jgi:hypothetical protein
VAQDEQLDVLDVQVTATANECPQQSPERRVEKREGHRVDPPNPAREGRDTRIRALRVPWTEELEDAERFDLVWLALAFRAWGALRPGGCALVASLDANGADLGSGVSWLRRWLRGGARSPTSRSAPCSPGGLDRDSAGAEVSMPMALARAREPRAASGLSACT